jgi:hypothetical protein
MRDDTVAGSGRDGRFFFGFVGHLVDVEFRDFRDFHHVIGHVMGGHGRLDTVGQDGDLTGQFGDGHRICVAATTASAPADGRGPDGSVPGKQFRDRVLL